MRKLLCSLLDFNLCSFSLCWRYEPTGLCVGGFSNQGDAGELVITCAILHADIFYCFAFTHPTTGELV